MKQSELSAPALQALTTLELGTSGKRQINFSSTRVDFPFCAVTLHAKS